MATTHALSLYDTSIPLLINTLSNLSHILTKATSHLTNHSLPESTFLTARIAPDMLPLPFQIQTACNTAKFTAVRVGGVTLPSVSDDETTLSQLQDRVKKTIEMLEGVKREDFDGAETKEIKHLGVEFTGVSYLTRFAIPNFFFHVSCAYMILRGKGVELGKLDYLLGTKGEEYGKKK